ncbi:UbiA prenyltransferase family-domain-containing protein [Chiua virens]|nr:UbiA prenyltransferase family-domain-containing protein [Chiua virens]
MTVQRILIDDIGYHFHTLYLFTKNDIMTAIIPVTLFAVASAPLCSFSHIFRSVLWVWLHVLQFNLPNQIKAPEEDRVNKPWRPIPAGRVTLYNVTIFRWLIVPLCLVYSSFYSIQLVFASIEMQLFTLWYNDLGGDRHWLLKNILPAFIYAFTELGGTLSAGCDPTRVSETAKLAVQLTVVVFSSTLQCQDFKDVEGDRLTGRRSIPIVFPVTSRFVAGFGLPMWSLFLCWIWDIDWFCTLAFVTYGGFVGARFFFLRTRDADKWSCKYYSIWFSLHHLLPGYWNYLHGSVVCRGGTLLQDTWDLFTGALFLKVF